MTEDQIQALVSRLCSNWRGLRLPFTGDPDPEFVRSFQRHFRRDDYATVEIGVDRLIGSREQTPTIATIRKAVEEVKEERRGAGETAVQRRQREKMEFAAHEQESVARAIEKIRSMPAEDRVRLLDAGRDRVGLYQDLMRSGGKWTATIRDLMASDREVERQAALHYAHVRDGHYFDSPDFFAPVARITCEVCRQALEGPGGGSVELSVSGPSSTTSDDEEPYPF